MRFVKKRYRIFISAHDSITSTNCVAMATAITMMRTYTTVIAAIAATVIITLHSCRAFQIGRYNVPTTPRRSLHHPSTTSCSYHDVLSNTQQLSLLNKQSISNYHSSTALFSTADDSDEVSKAESILDEMHKSKYPFRIIVIGNGAILETTSPLGPISKSSISPKSNERLLTFATEDASFEFHVKVEQIYKIAFIATEERNVARFLSESGTSICSLILGDKSSKAGEWFNGLVEKWGTEVIV